MADDIVERLRDRADAFDSEQGAPWKPLDREAADEIERLRAECEEQARLNGMGAERELGLRAEVEHLQHDIANYQRIVQTAEPGDNRIPKHELERIAQDDEIARLRAEHERLTVGYEQLRETYLKAADEIERLRAALHEICDYHIPDQPETADGDRLSWAYQQHGHLRRIALRALTAGHNADD
jgi:archaellum component FlaC